MSPSQDWRIALQEWLQKNPKVMPNKLKQLRKDFVKSFPREKLSEMTLEQYAAGRHYPAIASTFCHWIEFRTVELGCIRGDGIARFSIYWNDVNQRWQWDQSFQTDDLEVAFKKIKAGLVKFIQAAELKQFDQLDKIGDESLGNSSYSLQAKPLYLYFPNEFLPISNQSDLNNFLKYFNQTPKGGLHAKNRQLLELLRHQPEFDGFDTVQMMHFLYSLRQVVQLDLQYYAKPDPESALNLMPSSVQYLLSLIKQTNNLILYGSPGTGKTYTVSQFAKFFLEAV